MPHHIAYGMPGYGKSTLLHDLVAAQCDEQRFLVVDHEAQWGPDGIHWRGRAPPIRVFYKSSELPREWPDIGVFVFRDYDGREVAELARQLGSCTYVDDEADKAGRKEGFDESALCELANRGRHVENAAGEHTEVNMLLACRRAAKLHTDLSELAEQVYVFHCEGHNTIKRLIDDGHILEEQEQLVKALEKFELLHYPSRNHLRIKPIQTNRKYVPRPDESDEE